MQHRKHARNFADLIFMAPSTNQQKVKAVAAHYRQILSLQPLNIISDSGTTSDIIQSNGEPPKKTFKRCKQSLQRHATQSDDTNEPSSKRSGK